MRMVIARMTRKTWFLNVKRQTWMKEKTHDTETDETTETETEEEDFDEKPDL